MAINPALNKKNGVPLYLQIEERIRLGIAQGAWQVGELLPTEEEISRIFDVSRGTVRQALAKLVLDGVITRERRNGTRVVRGVDALGLVQVSPFRAIEAAGLQPSVQILAQEMTTVPPAVHKRWRRKHQQAMRFERLFLSNGVPVVYGNSYLPADTFGDLLDIDLSSDPLADVLRTRYHVVLTKIDEQMELVGPPAIQAKLLGLSKDHPALKLTMWQWAGEEPVEYGVFWLHPQQARFLLSGLVAFEKAPQ